MTLEITSTELKDGIVRITANDISEENLQWLERTREEFPQEKEYIFDTKNPFYFDALYKFLRKQKATKNCKTWGDALHAIVGTITNDYPYPVRVKKQSKKG